MADERHDVVIVGGGLIGLSIAWRARQRGLDVLVLERGEPGAAASSVGAGILAPVTDIDGAPRGVEALAVASCDAYPAFAAELEEASGERIDLRTCGISASRATRPKPRSSGGSRPRRRRTAGGRSG